MHKEKSMNLMLAAPVTEYHLKKYYNIYKTKVIIKKKEGKK